MKYFEFYNPVKICAGDGAIKHLNYELENLGVKKPLLLSDAGLKNFGMVEKVVKLSNLKNFALYTDIPTDSGVQVVNTILNVLTENDCDGIIALGGGSVIDTAKGVKMAYARTTNLKDLMGLEVVKKANDIPFIVLPTTAGTGSEVTNVAVIRDEDSCVKMEFITPYLMPNVALIDVCLTETLPARTTASTGIDALCHAIEGYSCMQKNPISDAYAITAIKLIFENIEKVVIDPKDKDARQNMAIASTLAGLAFGNSMVGGVHAIGHALGGACHISHGDAMSILLPHVMEFNKDKLFDVYAGLYPTICEKIYNNNLTNEQKCDMVINEVKKLLRKLNQLTGLPISLSETGKYDNSLARKVADLAINDGAVIVNPKQIDIGDVMDILNDAN